MAGKDEAKGHEPSAADLELSFEALAAATVGERGEVWLLQWLEQAEKAIEHVDDDVLRVAQPQLEAALVRLMSQPAPTSQAAPKPGRPSRHITARIFTKLFRRAEQRTLFDVVSTLLRTAAADNVKNGPDLKEYRVASFYVVSEIMRVHGAQVMSQFAECLVQSLKVAKNASLPPILRYQALLCLCAALSIGGYTLVPADPLGKEVTKTLRSLLGDKTSVVIRGTVDCMLSLLEHSNLLTTLPEIEAHLGLCIKALDVADFPTRRSLARLVAALLASTQIAGSAAPSPPQPTKGKKKKEGQEDDEEDDPYSSAVTAEEKGKTLLKPMEMLTQLSTAYQKPTTSRKAKNGLIDAYAALLTTLGSAWAEQNYPEILRHIIQEIGCPKPVVTIISPSVVRHDTLAGRKLATILLREVVGVRLLTEQGQVVAIREITASVLSRWPSMMPNQQAPSKHALVIALDEVAGLLRQLGSATQSIQDVLYDPLIQLLAHPSHSVQVAAALCLRTFCNSAPTRLPHTTSHVLELVNKNLSQMGQPTAPTDIARRTVGHAHGLAALISVVAVRPLYVSFDISAKVMSLAIQLLKQSGNHDLHISAVEIQVAWILVSALTTLGPNFVRVHLPQLLILWKNALPKTSLKDVSASQVRSENEWGFLLHIRECTLGAVLSFLRHNATLVTLDIGRRVVAMLSNGLSFLNDFSNRHTQLLQEQTPSTTSNMRLVDHDLMMRRRLLQCFVALGPHPAAEPLQSSLLTFCLAVMVDPERYTGSVVQAAIAASSGTFTSVWDSHDGMSYGVTSLLMGSDVEDEGEARINDWLNRDLTEVAIESVLHQPSIESNEHDALVVSAAVPAAGEGQLKLAPPPATGAVDAAIQLFAIYLPSASATTQASILQQMVSCVRSPKTEKNPGRRMAILVNSVAALTRSLRRQGSSRRLMDSSVVAAQRDMLSNALTHSDGRIRACAAEGYGRLCALGGSTFMAAQIQHCVSQIVSNTDPHCRAGFALAFGQIYGQVGSLSAGPVLKTVVDVLMSLGSDPHPLVHFWSLRSLSGVIATAGLTYEPYLNGTLGMITKLYFADTHEPEGGSVGSVNLRGDLPVQQNFCKILDAVIGVLGPELQTSAKVRSIIQLLVMELAAEQGDGIKVEAFRSLQHFMLFAIDSVDLPSTISVLRQQLQSNRRPLRVAAINSIYQLVQRNALLMSRLGGDQLVVDLFSLLDDDPSIEGVRAAIQSWLRQTADANPSGWIDLCQRIVSRATAAQVKEEQTNSTQLMLDEESQGLGAESGESSQPRRSTSRWRTQLFALQCLHEVFLAVVRAGRREHFDVKVAKAKGYNNMRPLMFSRVSDLIKMAFTASTASIMEIRLEGLTVLRDVVENFRGSPDLDFEDALLLEQFQAPIAAALTPAFATDSFPEVLASAIQVCAVFIGSGVIRETSKMGRILKLLTTALEACREAEILTIGDMKDLSSTASVMIKTAVFAAWAEFQVASVQQSYLVDVIRPHLPLLCPSWVASLREYARLSADADAGAGTSPTIFESIQATLIKEVALPYYSQAWLYMMRATASLIKVKSPSMLLAMDGKEADTSEGEPVLNDLHRSEPALYWPVLFGLAYEAVATTAASTDDPASLAAQTMETALLGLEALCQSTVAGDAAMQESVFNELCNLCYRLASTEPARTQALVVRVTLQLARNASSRASPDSAGQITQCLRVLVQILRSAIPGLSSMAASTARKSPSHHAGLLNMTFAACAEVADQTTAKLRDQVFGLAFGLFAHLLKDETSGIDLVGPTLPALKGLLERAFTERSAKTNLLSRVIHGLVSLALQNAEEVRSRQGYAAALKARNNVLATVLILTNVPSSIPISKAALEHCCFLVSRLISTNEFETSVTAIHCAKLLTAVRTPASSPIAPVAITQLLPSLIEYVARTSESEEPAPAAIASVQEVLKIFSGIFGSIGAQQRRQALMILLPVFLLLIKNTAPPLRAVGVAQVLQLATVDPGAFREAVGAFAPEEKATMEAALRGSLTKGEAAPSAKTGAMPTIALKSFG